MIPQFALRLICGLATFWCLVPREKITTGFFRIQMLITLGLSVLTALTLDQWDGSGSLHSGMFYSVIILGICSFVGSVLWTLGRRGAGTVFAGVIALISTASVIAMEFSPKSPSLASIANTLTSAWMLGAVTATMLLGHWYLTATGMSLFPFERANLLLAGTVVLRIVTVAAIAISTGSFLSPGQSPALTLLHWGGLIGPLVLSGLTWRILKYRNTQSATGVLYAATILAYMGEMAAALILASPSGTAG